MLKSCKYCNRIHDSKHDCGRKPIRKKHGTTQDKFRWTRAWQNKREEIRQRDQYMCQICKRRLYDYGAPQYNLDGLEVHHVIPLAEAYDKRLDNDNLITLCERHHEQAERGDIPRDLLIGIVSEQNSRT